ncbi:helix-turn-helix transcriptional regulator [Larkinella humicola]|uniref:Helix-turn-helix transcriptional regulator n=2 Tax=Larkinella humicola TaxID=2607654 RepID=A0A5N1JEG3_9BACT|nr:helix-turn-helix transcriptional regulator [Larkinella humicola]
MKVFIRYMVSVRCKMIVQAIFKKAGLDCEVIDLGEVDVQGGISVGQLNQLRTGLLEAGLELIDDKKHVLIEKVKNVIVELVHYTDELPKMKNSDYISSKLQYDYTYLANLFSEAEGTTIEKYIIAHKIERAKELLRYDELNLTQISYKLNYSSVAHLSNQFKKVTGVTPSCYKQLKQNGRTALENL